MDKSKITILIIDDTPQNIMILGEYLSEYSIKAATSGPAALDVLEKGLVPTIILLDIVMPGMDGYEVCRRIKKFSHLEDVPVIFISSMAEVSSKVKGFEAGAVDYITKPFHPKEVKSRIVTHVQLSLYRQQLASINELLEQKIHERTYELRVSKEKAEEGNRLKTHFLAMISHELRTPLVGILGYSDALLEGIEDPMLKDFARNLNDSASRLRETLESILTLTKLESRELTVKPAKFNLHDKANQLISKHLRNASTKGLQLSMINNSTDTEWVLDVNMFEIIFNNIVNNAVKFTQKGVIRVELFDETANNVLYRCIRVTDTGIGIPHEKHKVIFEEFRQVYEGVQRNFEGVGLGLSLARKYAEMMNGFIGVQSEEGKGSSFTVRMQSCEGMIIQEKANPEDVVEQAGTAAPGGKKLPEILLVEDDFTSIEITKMFLAEIAKVDSASNSEKALALAKSKKYDIILMDINLGKGLNGIEITKLLRGMESYSKTPIVAFTAFVMDEDEKSFLQDGCTYYFPKPFSKNKLIELIKNICEVEKI